MLERSDILPFIEYVGSRGLMVESRTRNPKVAVITKRYIHFIRVYINIY